LATSEFLNINHPLTIKCVLTTQRMCVVAPMTSTAASWNNPLRHKQKVSTGKLVLFLCVPCTDYIKQGDRVCPYVLSHLTTAMNHWIPYSIKTLDQLSDYQLLKKDSAPCS